MYKQYFKTLLRMSSIFILSYFVLDLSKYVNLEQLLFDDLKYFGFINPYNIVHGKVFSSLLVSLFTNLLIYFLRPFIEVYLIYYFKYSFYILVNLLSISTVFITLRIYGYSRLLIILYLFAASLALYFEDKI